MRKITAQDIELAHVDAETLLKHPADFGYFGDNDQMFKTWTLGPVIHHRDSGVLHKSNSRVLFARLAKEAEAGLIEPDSWEEVECNHWVVGWVCHLSYRVLDDQGEPTKIARFLRLWMDYLMEVYPIADDDDHSELEAEETRDNVRFIGEGIARRDELTLPEGWVDEVYCWLMENDWSALENCDDRGGWPSDAEMKAAFAALGYIKDEEPAIGAPTEE